MIDLALSELDHDLYFPDIDLRVVKDADQLEQNLRIRLQFFLNEWFLDSSAGLPFYTDILVKNPNIPNIENIIKAHIIDTVGVTEILEFNSDFDNSLRTYSIDFKVRTIFGEEELSVTIFN